MIPIEYVSHSRLELFRKNPVFYKKLYIEKSVEREVSPAMTLGSLVHKMLLEPTKVEERFAVAPVCDKRTKAGKETWETFKAGLAEGIEVITHDDVEQATRMVAAVHENTSSQYLLQPTATREEEILTAIEIGGVNTQIKFIPDLYSTSAGWLADFKTVSSYDPLDWGKECVFNGYLRQLALYRFCLRSMGVVINDVYHIVVDKGEYPSSMVVQFDNGDIDRAENQVFDGIRKFLAAHESENFLPHYYGIVPKITAPAWSWR